MNKKIFKLLLVTAYATLLAVGLAQKPTVLMIEIKGYISPGTALYVEESMKEAGRYSAVLITLDTLGGQADAMLRIVETIERSSVPVIGYVYPPGGKAMSAGTYILMATDLAAMAPGTLIGSAQPVAGGEPVTDSKTLNFFAEKMGTLAENHGRNREEAVKIVLENKNFNHQAALEAGLIEVVATDVGELLQKADGRVVKSLFGERVLNVKGAEIIIKPPSIASSFTSFLSDPLVSSLLLTIGIIVLIFSLPAPGWGGEVAGIVMIVLGLVGQGLSINVVGALLIIVGAGLLLYELFSPGFGLIGLGGIAALTFGLILVGAYAPAPAFVAEEYLKQFQSTIIALAVFSAAFLIFTSYKAFKGQRKKPLDWLDKKGRAVEKIAAGRTGYIVVAGEYWRAKALKDIDENQSVKVVGRENGLLLVEPDQPST